MRNNLSRLFKTLLINVVAFGAIAHAGEANSGYQCVVDTYGEYQASRAWSDYNGSGYFFSSNNEVPNCSNCGWIYQATYTNKTELAAKQEFLAFCYNTFGTNVKDVSIVQGVRALTRSGNGIAPLMNNTIYENAESLKKQHLEAVRGITAHNRELCQEIAASPDLFKCEKFD